MRRREFIAGLVGAVGCPLAVHAQQAGVPVIGFLNSESPDLFAYLARAFREGLKGTGYVEGEDVAIDTAGPTANMIVFRRWWPT